MTNRNTVVALAGVAVVLVAVIAVMLVGRVSVPSPVPTVAAPAVSNAAAPGLAPSGGTAFDPATATKALKNSPAGHVEAYYADLLKGKYPEAFALQPAASRAGGTAADFATTQKSYGMASYVVGKPAIQGDAATVSVSQDLGANGKWTTVWSFQKAGGTWYVRDRRVQMGP